MAVIEKIQDSVSFESPTCFVAAMHQAGLKEAIEGFLKESQGVLASGKLDPRDDAAIRAARGLAFHLYPDLSPKPQFSSHTGILFDPLQGQQPSQAQGAPRL